MTILDGIANATPNSPTPLFPCSLPPVPGSVSCGVSNADQIQSNGHLGRVAAAIGIGFFALITFTGCTSEPTPEPPNSGTNGPIVEERVTLDDGRDVTCLTYDRALSCDWGSAR